MIKLREAVIVEGKYDQIRLSAIVDAVIITTNGFGVFQDRDKLRLIRRLAMETGVIILTDSDAAGFQIRAKLAAGLPKEQVRHAYIPDFYGKERRKDAPSGEGKLGVEGMETAVIEEALRRCGALGQGDAPHGAAVDDQEGADVTKADLYALGLSGGPHSSVYRQSLLQLMNLPARMPVNSLLRVANRLYTRDEFLRLVAAATAAGPKGQ